MPKELTQRQNVTIRFAGDSGDGMQVTGDQFTNTSAIMGNDISTFPDFPAEIRAPAGTLPGVSGFQINFSSTDIRTPGDEVDVLVVMNPAALQVNLSDLKQGGIIIANESAFTASNLKKIGLDTSPLEGIQMSQYQVFSLPISELVHQALKDLGLTKKEVERCKNFYALGIVYWMHNRTLKPTEEWIQKKFAKKPLYVEANLTALRSGFSYADVTEMFDVRYQIPQAPIEKGTYRKITGNEAMVYGLIVAAQKAKTPLFYGSYPITPASDILHHLSRYKHYDIMTFQAEDEIAAMGATIGAAFAGILAVTGTSGPGLCLKAEAINLAIMTELPMVVINVQRGGPSTGLPTKTEQSDLLQTLWGRNGDSPLIVLAACSPSDCFATAFEAIKLSTKYMTPVIVLSDGYIGNSSEPWKLPDIDKIEDINIEFLTNPKGFKPYSRQEGTYARPWVRPGTPGLEHRIGGLEKAAETGNVSYDPVNHQVMTELRARKVNQVAQDIPPTQITGSDQGELLVVGWGGTYGAILSAVEQEQQEGKTLSCIHLRHLNPLPPDLGEILSRFKTILVPELNNGQLIVLLRSKYPYTNFVPMNKIQGKPFLIRELRQKIQSLL